MKITIKLPHRHKYRVLPRTTTIVGADYLCRKCYDIQYYAWRTPLERIDAEIYLAIVESEKVFNKFR